MIRKIGSIVTLYAIERNHGRTFGPFVVSVPEAGHRGIGLQVPLGKRVLGISVGWFPALRSGAPKPVE